MSSFVRHTCYELTLRIFVPIDLLKQGFEFFCSDGIYLSDPVDAAAEVLFEIGEAVMVLAGRSVFDAVE